MQPQNSPDSTLFAVPDEAVLSIRRWLLIGVTALALAGLFSILLVLARTPQVQEMIPWRDFFHTALVVHVDLAVLVWFLSGAGMLWSLIGAYRRPVLAKGGWICFAIGTLLLAASPFLGAGDPLMNNYIPVLQHPLFFVALGFLAAGIALEIAAVMVQGISPFRGSAEQFGVASAAWITAAAMIAFVWSVALLPVDMNGLPFYELAFWGGGHILQFTHIQMMLVSWMILAGACGITLRITGNGRRVLYVLGVIAALAGLSVYGLAEIDDGDHRQMFTTQMMVLGGIASLVLGLALLWPVLRLARKRESWKNPLFACLLTSMILFGMGGIIGWLIDGVNVVIPAHYHGSIVGVTLAFMGLAYWLMPRIGYQAVRGRMACWQPWLYAGGQLLHITGLAWSGGYGIARKTAETVEGVGAVHIALGMMGLGGLLAVMGGILFVIVMIKSLRNS